MRVFLVKITNRENVDFVLNKAVFTHKDIYNFEAEINVGDPVFIYFSGDRAQIDWEQGLVGCGKITRGPYDKGYNIDKPRYFKLDIQPIIVLQSPIPPKKTKLHPIYQNDLYDVPYVGANHFPNQAIAKADGDGAIALFHLLNEYDPATAAYFPVETATQTTSSSQTLHEAGITESVGPIIFLPKPFLLLAGISGTGKTRFVREQAKASAAQYAIGNCENYCLVPARPDWHEPSDLLGYISRIGAGGARFIVTDLLRFIAAAWKHAAVSASADGVVCKSFAEVCPFWLCLDEMNLAPVEQYFADYLSILETRLWDGETYACDPLLKPALIQQLDAAGQDDLWEKLGISDADSAGLRDCFLHKGISLPPNLIVAGTVNMDETTHGFSRKVIDRALTIDFGEFFPNDYGRYFEEDIKTVPRTLGFSRLSGVRHENELAGAEADPNGRKTIAFLGAVKDQLEETPFALAFRALNEALLMLICFKPADEAELQAVWDDFLMMKVLPRIEGDAEKLGSQDDSSLLTRLAELLRVQLSAISAERIDLLNQSLSDDTPVKTVCRSLKKLAWMQQRLVGNGFTAFWP